MTRRRRLPADHDLFRIPKAFVDIYNWEGICSSINTSRIILSNSSPPHIKQTSNRLILHVRLISNSGKQNLQQKLHMNNFKGIQTMKFNKQQNW